MQELALGLLASLHLATLVGDAVTFSTRAHSASFTCFAWEDLHSLGSCLIMKALYLPLKTIKDILRHTLTYQNLLFCRLLIETLIWNF